MYGELECVGSVCCTDVVHLGVRDRRLDGHSAVGGCQGYLKHETLDSDNQVLIRELEFDIKSYLKHETLDFDNQVLIRELEFDIKLVVTH